VAVVEAVDEAGEVAGERAAPVGPDAIEALAALRLLLEDARTVAKYVNKEAPGSDAAWTPHGLA